MGKLNIAHHKSYHPYRRDNIEKVRRDEEEARLKEEREEGRMMLADSEARIDRLRERAGAAKPSGRRKDELEEAKEHLEQQSVLPMTGGHINLFEDLEQQSMVTAIRASKKEPAETEKGVPLAPSAKDLKPWYSEKSSERKEPEEERMKRELARKSMNDPLTSITHQLASRHSSSSMPNGASSRFRPPRSLPPSSSSETRPPEVNARLSRESSERERALELIKRKKREMAGSETPSTVHGGDYGGYGDVFNRREVEEAHRGWERRRDSGGRGWGEERDRRRGDVRRGW